MVHVLHVGTWPSRSCAIDSAVSNMAESLCLCHDLAFVLAQNTASGGVRGDLRITVRASPSGGSHPSGTPQPAGVPLVRTGASAEWGTPPVSFGASPDDQMSVAASEGEPSLSGDDDSAALPPSGVVALSEPDPEMTAMLSRAAENVGLVWNPPPRPDPSRLYEWFLGGGVALVFSAPLRCHSFRKCMRSLQGHGRHLLLPEINLVAPPPSPPSMVEPLWGTRASPLWSGLWPCSCVQQSLPLCGVNRVSPHGPVSTHQASLAVLIEPVGRRLLPYTPWRYCRSIRPKHWETCTRVGTTWRFYTSCVLRRTSRSERRRWLHSLWVVRCPRLWSRSAISGCVSLTWRSRRRYSSWMLPCHRPAFSATLSRAVPSSFRQHRSRLRRSSTSCAGGNPLLLPLRLQPLSLLVAVGAPLWPPPLPRRGSSLPPCGVVEPVTDRTPSPSRPPPDQAASASARGPETGDPEMERTARREMVTAPLPPPEEGRVENPLFRFVFVPPLAQQPAVPKTSIKEQFPQSLGLKRRRVVYRASRDHFPPPLSPGRGGLPKSTPPAHLWNRVRAVALKPPLQVVTRKPGSCVSSHTRRNQVSVTLHTQTPPPAITGPGPGPCVPHRCPTTGTSVHPHPRSVQSGSRRAVPSSTSRRVKTPSPGGSADLGTVRSCPGRPVCISRNHPLPRVLLPNRGNARHGCTGTQLAPGPAQICVPPSEPTSTDTVQDQGGRGAGLVSGSILAQQDLVPGTHAPRDSPSLANSSEEGSAFSETGHPMAPAPGPVETPRMVPGWDAEVLADLPQEVALTITSARAPSMRRAYTLKWNLFVEWCSSHQEDPRRCSIRAVLSFLQQGLERRLSPSTLKVYVAAISAYHDPVEGKSVGKHNLVVRFLRGARRLNPPRPPSLPSWDLALVLRALITAPFEPLQSVELKFLSMKTLLLTALASIKRVGDLQAFSVDDSCLQFGPADSSATLRPRPGYVPKVPTTPFRDQVVNLQALPPEEADPALALLCPVRALRQYTDRTQSFRTSEQLFVCYGGQQKGKAVSKQRMAHWIVDAITLAYEAQGVPCPLRLRAHSTRGVASSWALARGASLADICRAAGWATPNTFARFYSLRVEPVSSCVLTSNG